MTLQRSFVIRLATGVFFINLFVYLLAGLSLYQIRQQYEKQTELSTRNIVRSLDTSISGMFDKINISLTSLVYEAERQLAAGGINVAALNDGAIRQKTLHPELDGIRFADAEGNVRFGTSIPSGKPVNIADRSYFKKLRENRDTGAVLSAPVVGRITGKWTVIIANRFNRPDGAFAGVVFAVLPLDCFSRLFSTLDVGKHGAIGLRDDQLATIVRFPEPEEMGKTIGKIGMSSKATDTIKAHPQSGTFTAEAKDRITRTVSYKKISGYPLYVIVGQAVSDYLAAWQKELGVALALLFLFTLLTIISAKVVINRRKNDQLSLDALRSSEAELEQHRSNLELLVQNRTAELNQTLQRAEKYFTISRAPMLELDATGRIVRINPAGCSLLGWNEVELVGRDWFATCVSPEESATTYSYFCSLVDRSLPEEQAAFEQATFTSTVVSKDGSRRLMLSLNAFLRGDDGAVIGMLSSAIDITEMHQTEMKLRLAHEASEAANQAKSMFLANMSHEIRTPMNAVLGFAQLLERDSSLSPLGRNRVATIMKSGEHLLAIINDILEMSRIEDNRIELHPQPLALRDLFEDLSAIFRMRAEEKGLLFSIDCAAELPRYVVADLGKLRQILINLLGNAFKFTTAGSITVRAFPMKPGRIAVEVQDSGIGISPEEQMALFCPFVRTKSGEQAAGGTGLGLAISREYARLMGGDIAVVSSVGKGSCFRFDFFAEESATGPDAPEVARRICGLAPGQGEIRVLVVDDMDVNRELLRGMLEPLGFAVEEASDGAEAFVKVQSLQPHVIFMDLVMPGMDGAETTQTLRNLYCDDSVSIIGITASTFEKEKKRFLDSGINAFIAKPFREQELFAALAEHAGVLFETEKNSSVTDAEENREIPTVGKMSPEWREAFRLALQRRNITRLRELAEKAQGVDMVLATWLLDLTGRYDLDRLSKLDLGE